MKTIKVTGKITTAWSKPVSPALPYSCSFSAYEHIDEVRAANDMLSDDEQVKVRNAQRKAAAKGRATLQTLADAGYVKPDIQNDDYMKLKTIYDVLIAAKKTHDEARSLASVTLGIEWPEDDE